MKERTLSAIARDILAHWPRPNYAAIPYIRAMAQLETVKDHYGYDPGTSIVRYFLVNAASWKGPEARRIKAELKGLVS